MPTLERSPFLFGDGRSPTATRRDRIRLGVIALFTLVLVVLGRFGIPSGAPLWPLWRPVLYLTRSFAPATVSPRAARVILVPTPMPPAAPGETVVRALGVLPGSGHLLVEGGSADGIPIGATVLAPPRNPGGPLRYVGRILSQDRIRSRAILPRDPGSLLPVAIEGLGADGFLARGTGASIRCLYLTASAAREVGYDSHVLLAAAALAPGREAEVIEVGWIRGTATAEEAFFAVGVEPAVEPARLDWVILR